jgi:hypothetical protein
VRGGRLARAALVGAALGQAACQSYRPIPLSAAPAADAVRVELTAEGAERLAATLGPGVAAVEGRVAELTADSLRLTVSESVLRTGQSVAWRGERVAVGRGDVAALRQRRPSAARSALLGLAVVGGAALAATQLGQSGGGGTARGGGGIPR